MMNKIFMFFGVLLFATVCHAGTWGININSSSLESDYLDQDTVADGTWYTITDYSGSGYFTNIAAKCASQQLLEFRITVDGSAITWVNETSYHYLFFTGSSSSAFNIPFYVEFDTSLKVEVRENGGTDAIDAMTIYAVLSEEAKREVVLAGGELTDRDYTYPVDVMVVYFRHGPGQPITSNKIVFPMDNLLKENEDGSAVVYERSFETLLNRPRIMKQPISGSKAVSVPINGKQVMVEVEDGKISKSALDTIKLQVGKK